MSNTVQTVAVGFLAPTAIRVFLEMANYDVSVFTGDMSTLNLREDRPEKNVVLLPNFSKRGLLAPFADRIYRLVVFVNGRHEPIVDMDVPILDGEVDNNNALFRSRAKTPDEYIQKIRDEATPLDLGEAPNTAVTVSLPPQKEIRPGTVDQWLDTLSAACGEGSSVNFDREVEYPICQYLVGELSRKEFKGALKTLVSHGCDEATVKSFYRWLSKEYVSAMTKALKDFLFPESEDKAPAARVVAKRYNVDKTDIELLENIYDEIQTQQGEVEDDE